MMRRQKTVDQTRCYSHFFVNSGISGRIEDVVRDYKLVQYVFENNAAESNGNLITSGIQWGHILTNLRKEKLIHAPNYDFTNPDDVKDGIQRIENKMKEVIALITIDPHYLGKYTSLFAKYFTVDFQNNDDSTKNIKNLMDQQMHEAWKELGKLQTRKSNNTVSNVEQHKIERQIQCYQKIILDLTDQQCENNIEHTKSKTNGVTDANVRKKHLLFDEESKLYGDNTFNHNQKQEGYKSDEDMDLLSIESSNVCGVRRKIKEFGDSFDNSLKFGDLPIEPVPKKRRYQQHIQRPSDQKRALFGAKLQAAHTHMSTNKTIEEIQKLKNEVIYSVNDVAKSLKNHVAHCECKYNTLLAKLDGYRDQMRNLAAKVGIVGTMMEELLPNNVDADNDEIN